MTVPGATGRKSSAGEPPRMRANHSKTLLIVALAAMCSTAIAAPKGKGGKPAGGSGDDSGEIEMDDSGKTPAKGSGSSAAPAPGDEIDMGDDSGSGSASS